jgi:alpha-beta hydrolase superfamily lysophospholipase
MKYTILILSCFTCSFIHGQNNSYKPKEINFQSSDNLTIYGDLYQKSKKATTILLFHQSRSNAKGEYGMIAKKLFDRGYNVLAIDLRSGGQLYGNYNRTVANIPLNKFKYCDVYADLENALGYLNSSGFTGNKIAWGSSYSAALVIKLAYNYPEQVNAVLAFSPGSGGPMKDCSPNEYFETLKTPLLLLRPKKEMEIESVKNQYDLAAQNGHQTYIADNGVHGSSMLVKERVKLEVQKNWDVVLDFIKIIANK